jgi:phosphatidylserine/phosphatidylglycerophosphate/cardiolipin synthase-like enzyme
LRTCQARCDRFALIDVEGDDPVVSLGSYNWTGSGSCDNDENAPIIHDHKLARAYYAEWQRLWATLELEDICNPSAHPCRQ